MNAPESSSRGRLAAAAGLLAAVTFVLYLSTGGFEFLNYDDPDYVSANPVVARGLSAPGIAWAFGFQAANWHPLTWFSHMLDVQLFGLEPGPMHLVNAGLHALCAGLLLLALGRLSGAFWPSLLVAALFAAHPLRVQCVAWIAERKELLAAVFFFLLLLAHERHARARSRPAYLAGIAFLALGCMAKPMLVTAPFVLLLLDRWPLERFGRERTARLWLEKLPLFAVAATASVLTLLAQHSGHAVAGLSEIPTGDRLLTAAAGVLAYLRATVWPSGLAAYYPNPLLSGGSLALPAALGALAALGGSVLAWRTRRSVPALFTGWFWFLGMLVPVIGLVQVGDQAWADRYAYLPVIGLSVALVFGLAQVQGQRGALLVLAGGAACAALSVVTLRTLPHWRTSVTLFEHALEVTENNWIAHNNLGLALLEQRDLSSARAQLETALEVRPGFGPALYNLGLAHQAAGEPEQAERAYLRFLEQSPENPDALLRLAALARARGETDAAVALFERAVAARPQEARVWAAFAELLMELREVDRAVNSAKSALQFDPRQPEANLILATVSLQRNEIDQATRHLKAVLEQEPPRAEAYALLGRTRTQLLDLDGARAAYERALQLDPSSVRARYDFGLLLLKSGEREDARGQFEAVLDIRPTDAHAMMALAVMALEDDKAQEAVSLLKQALARQPDLLLAWVNLATAHEQLRDWPAALRAYERAFELGTPAPDAALAAAWILATGPGEELLDGERALELAGLGAQRQAPKWREVVAAALARLERFEEAAALQEEAVQQARSEQHGRVLTERLELYRSGKPFTRR